jgi:hypothetical protein
MHPLHPLYLIEDRVMKTVSLAALTLSVAFAGAALAQNTPNPAVNPGSTKVAPPEFKSLDTNKDGRVSRDEAKSQTDLTSTFATLDTDRDSYLSETEFGKWKPSSSSGSTAPDASKSTPSNPPAAQ